MVRLTDRPDMTLDVYCGRKTTIQNLSGLEMDILAWFLVQMTVSPGGIIEAGTH